MADFVQTMKDWRRMCAAMGSCDICPLCTVSCWAKTPSDLEGDFIKREALIAKWAAEHPEPVYPTWGEWLMSIGVISGLFPKGAIDALGNLKQPIPADMAEKLGIKPKITAS